MISTFAIAVKKIKVKTLKPITNPPFFFTADNRTYTVDSVYGKTVPKKIDMTPHDYNMHFADEKATDLAFKGLDVRVVDYSTDEKPLIVVYKFGQPIKKTGAW